MLILTLTLCLAMNKTEDFQPHRTSVSWRRQRLHGDTGTPPSCQMGTSHGEQAGREQGGDYLGSPSEQVHCRAALREQGTASSVSTSNAGVQAQ
jgi:hypothetical protein